MAPEDLEKLQRSLVLSHAAVVRPVYLMMQWFV
ncbi:hypothetical protein ABVN80_19875 [Acinetobacter baumannii]